jgi:hypothetical protein
LQFQGIFRNSAASWREKGQAFCPFDVQDKRVAQKIIVIGAGA